MSAVGITFAVVAAAAWGLVYAFNQKILESVSPLTLLFVGSLVAAVLTLPFVLLGFGSVRQLAGAGKQLWLLIIASEALFLFASFFILSSIKYLGAPTAAVIEITYPLFVAVFTLLLFGGTLNIYLWLGAVLIFFGSVLIIRFA